MWDLLIRLFGNIEYEENHWEKRFLAFLERHPRLYTICTFLDVLISPSMIAASNAPRGIFFIFVLIFIIIPIMLLTALLAIYLQ